MATIIPTLDQAERILAAKMRLTQKQVAHAFTPTGAIFAAIKSGEGLDAAIEWRRCHDAKATA